MQSLLSPPRTPHFLKRLALCALGCLAGLIALEGALRLYHGVFDAPSRRMVDPELVWRQKPNLRMTLRQPDFSSTFESNSQGIRADREYAVPKPAGTIRILALGDSFTESAQVSLAECWTQKLESALNAAGGSRIEVLNVGCSGYGPYQESIYLEKVAARFQPDIVLLMFFHNDVSDDDYAMDVLPRLQEHGALRADRSLSAAVRIKHFFTRNSHLCRYFLDKVRRIPRLERFLVRTGAIAHREKVENPWHVPSCGNLDRAFDVTYCKNETPESEKLWRNSMDNVAKIKSLCDGMGARMGLVYAPPLVYFQWESWLKSRHMGDPGQYEREKPLRYARAKAAMLDIPFLDLTPAVAAEGGAGLYLRLDTHWNKDGNAVVARTLSEWVKKEFPR